MPLPVEAQAPIEMHHFGCGICCQMRRSTGASLKGTRPAQMSTSAWRGEKLMRSIPKRARSKRLAADAMNSMAQQAVPKGIGHRELALAQSEEREPARRTGAAHHRDRAGELAVVDPPRDHEHGLDVEDDEQHRDHV